MEEGFWKAAHEARLDATMLLGCAFLLLVGAGPLSLDSLLLAPPPTQAFRHLAQGGRELR